MIDWFHLIAGGLCLLGGVFIIAMGGWLFFWRSQSYIGFLLCVFIGTILIRVAHKPLQEVFVVAPTQNQNTDE